MIQQVRKLFRFSSARNIPRGASARLATAYSALSSARAQCQAAIIAEHVAQELQSKKRQKLQNREQIARN